MGEEIIRRESAAPARIPSDSEIDRIGRLAKAMAASGLFKDAQSIESAYAKMLIGIDLGLSPTQALMNLHLVEGKPEFSANQQAVWLRQGGYDYRVTTPDDKREQECEIDVFLGPAEAGNRIGRERFTIEQAREAGLANKQVWKAYPRNMLFARCISNAVAIHAPEVTGGIRIYYEGEIDTDRQDAPTAEVIDTTGFGDPDDQDTPPAWFPQQTLAPEPEGGS